MVQLIRKYLIFSKNIYLSSSKPSGESSSEQTRHIELYFPLEIFWKIEEHLQQAEYLTTTNRDNLDQKKIYKEIYHMVARYIVTEKDRVWFYDHLVSTV